MASVTPGWPQVLLGPGRRHLSFYPPAPVNHDKEGLEVLQSETSLKVCQWGQSGVGWGQGVFSTMALKLPLSTCPLTLSSLPTQNKEVPIAPRHHLLPCAWILTGGYASKSLCGHFNLLAFIKIQKRLMDRQDICPPESSDLER